MSKIYYFLIALMALAFVIPNRAFAQGMMNLGSNEKTVDQSLSDDEYEKLGEDWMEIMMGDNHEESDEQMSQMMGGDFLRQMHIAMGKQSQNQGSFGMMPMMGTSGQMGASSKIGWNSTGLLASNSQFSGIHPVLMIITWLSFITFLLAGARWFFIKANK